MHSDTSVLPAGSAPAVSLGNAADDTDVYAVPEAARRAGARPRHEALAARPDGRARPRPHPDPLPGPLPRAQVRLAEPLARPPHTCKPAMPPTSAAPTAARRAAGVMRLRERAAGRARHGRPRGCRAARGPPRRAAGGRPGPRPLPQPPQPRPGPLLPHRPPPSPLCGGEWAEVTAPKVAGCGCAYRPRRAGRDNLLYTLKGRADRPARHLRRNAACHGPARRFTQLG
jgi:hypothetical protein